MRFDDDALDEALFALPLAEPPHDLRASIFAATIWREAPAISVPEGIALASIAAALAWIAVLMLPQLGATLANAFSNFAVLSWLSWLGLGAAATIGAAALTEFQPTRASAQAGKTTPGG